MYLSIYLSMYLCICLSMTMTCHGAPYLSSYHTPSDGQRFTQLDYTAHSAAAYVL
jgi:hypothetical protein